LAPEPEPPPHAAGRAESRVSTGVKILDEEYQIRGASPELVQELAGFVDRKFREMQTARPTMDWKRLAVMVCLNIAEDLYQERIRRSGVISEACAGARRCRETLDRAVRIAEGAVAGEGSH